MFIKKTPIEPTGLELAIDQLFSELAGVNADSPEYAKMVSQLASLYKLKEIDSPKPISKDTVALIAGNLAGILLILNYERANVVASKALSFVMKLK